MDVNLKPYHKRRSSGKVATAGSGDSGPSYAPTEQTNITDSTDSARRPAGSTVATYPAFGQSLLNIFEDVG